MPDPGYGSNFSITTPDVHNHAVSVAKRAIGDAQRHAQMRLVLRGEPGLVSRVIRHEQDLPRCRQILLDLCRRYGMSSTSSMSAPISLTKEVHQTSGTATQPGSGWKKVTAKPSLPLPDLN